MICITNACQQHSDRCPTPWTCGKYEHDAHYVAMTAPVAPIKDEITFAGPEPLDPARVERIALRVLLVMALLGLAVLLAYGPGWAQWLTWLSFR